MGLTRPTTQARGADRPDCGQKSVPSTAGATCVKREAYLTPSPMLPQGATFKESFSASSHLSVPPNTGHHIRALVSLLPLGPIFRKHREKWKKRQRVLRMVFTRMLPAVFMTLHDKLQLHSQIAWRLA